MATLIEMHRIQLQVDGIPELVAFCEEARKMDDHGITPLSEKMFATALEIVDAMADDIRKAREKARQGE